MDANEMESQQQKAAGEDDFRHTSTAGLNKFSLLCALLASTNSILLGYGESRFQFVSLPTTTIFLTLKLSKSHDLLMPVSCIGFFFGQISGLLF